MLSGGDLGSFREAVLKWAYEKADKLDTASLLGTWSGLLSGASCDTHRSICKSLMFGFTGCQGFAMYAIGLSQMGTALRFIPYSVEVSVQAKSSSALEVQKSD